MSASWKKIALEEQLGIVNDGSGNVSLGTSVTATNLQTLIGVDASGTDNSTDVTLATVASNYLSISGQEITAGTVPVALGGTGATSASAARTNLDVDQAGTDNSTDVTLATVASNYLSISGQEITAGTVPVALGGTGATTAAAARTNLGVDASGTDNSTDVTLATVASNYLSISGQEITAGTVPVALGGTGATTAAGARTNLGVDASGTDNSTDVTLATVAGNYLSISGQEITAGTVPVALGGTGATTAAGARTNLGVDASGTDNSTDVTLTGSYDYLSISGQEITLGQITNADLANNKTTLGATDLTLGSTVTDVTGMTSMSGVDVAAGTDDSDGGDLTFSAGVGTGTGVGGDIFFKVAAPAAVAGNAQNTVSTAITIAAPTSATGDSTVTIHGDLVVDGNNSSIDVQTLNVEDKTIVVADGAANNAACDGAGIIVDTAAGTTDRAHLQWMDSAVGVTGWSLKEDGAVATYPQMGVAVMNRKTSSGAPADSNMPTGALYYVSNATGRGLYLYHD